MRVILYEDRASDIVAAKILVASVRRHSPTVEIDVTLPGLGSADQRWFAKQPRLTLRTAALGSRKYDVKPAVLSRALDEGAEEAVWIDSDILVARDFRPLFAKVAADAIVVTEETFGVPFQGGTSRTVGLGLAVGRRMPVTANSCVTRVTPRHRPLLEAWDRRLGEADYLAAQARPYEQRAHFLKGDQDVLTGLLGSDRFRSIPIHWLRRGRDVAHCFQLGGVGYNVLERTANMASRRVPVFLHTCGDRPWRPPEGRPTLHLETSPYTLLASTYEEDIEESLAWSRPSLPAARALRSLFGDRPNATGFLPALGRELVDQRILKTLVRPLFKPEP